MSVETIFAAAAQKTNDDRGQFLEEACGTDAELRRKVERLLKAHDAAGDFLESPAHRPDGTIDFTPIAERVGTKIGPYILREQIGEGGFGLVFVAEQLEPVKRKVALKVIKPGMDSAQVIARFEAERQALALMDHPNIARVFDAGATDSGRPYFVMELVRGIPITEYCDQNQLSPRDRLDLFITVCQAIQHAHQKGIIHRDIKPSNVLVTSHDGKPVAKVIDFGVAKAIHQHLTERTIYTNFAQMVGTPLYMSPEQAEMSGLDIDTRSDIYSLGVLLYELLTGTTPLEKKQLREAAYDEIRRLIREDEPQKPSTRLSQSGGSLPSVAAQRKMEPAKLSKFMRGDLDWITMKALEKDRTRRYETANGLARDIQRYLGDEPVEACPPTAGYRLRKFARKNRAALATAAAIAILLLSGAAVSTWQAVRATRAEAGTRSALVETERARSAEADERVRAEANEKRALNAASAEKSAKVAAQAREAEVNAVVTFLEDRVFAAARPEGQDGGLGRAVTLRRAVEAALPFVEGSFANQPLIEARLRMTLERSFSYLGEAKIAAEQCEVARALYLKKFGPGHPDTLASANNLANCYAALGRQTEALKLREETLAVFKAKLGAEHPNTLSSMMNLANSYADLGREADAVKLYEETLAIRKAKLGPEHPDTLMCRQNLASSYSNLGRHAEALKLREETLALYRAKFGADHPDTLDSMTGLANSYADSNRHTEAFKLREETLALSKSKLGPEHPETLTSMMNLANSYAQLGRLADAVKLHEETLGLRKAKFGPDHPDTLTSMYNLAICYANLGRHADALKLHEATLELRKSKLGREHPDTLASMMGLADSYAALGRRADALGLYEDMLALAKASLGPEHPKTLASMMGLADSYAALGRHADALKLHEETLALRKAKLGPDHRDALASMNDLANSYAALGRDADALKLREETLALQKAKLGPDHPDTLVGMNNLASSYAALGRHADALKLREETLALRKVKLGSEHPDTLWSMSRLANSYLQLGRHAEALKLYEETLALRRAKLGADHPDTVNTIYDIACCHAVMIPAAEDRGRQTELAMNWLKQSVTAGYADIANMKKDKDLDPLRGREDFKKLIAELEAKAAVQSPKP